MKNTIALPKEYRGLSITSATISSDGKYCEIIFSNRKLIIFKVSPTDYKKIEGKTSKWSASAKLGIVDTISLTSSHTGLSVEFCDAIRLAKSLSIRDKITSIITSILQTDTLEPQSVKVTEINQTLSNLQSLITDDDVSVVIRKISQKVTLGKIDNLLTIALDNDFEHICNFISQMRAVIVKENQPKKEEVTTT